MLAIGVALILAGLAAFRRTRAFIARCRTADGRIADYTREESEDGIHYYSVMRFRDEAGVEHELRGGRGLQAPPVVGAPVAVTYDPANPTNAWITGTPAPWIIPWLVVVVGVAVVVAGLVVRAEG